MILACQKITKAFGGDTILNNINFLINEGEKAALIGINGAGKTTLLKIITGEYEADGGEVVLQKGATMGYLSQVIDVTSSPHHLRRDARRQKRDHRHGTEYPHSGTVHQPAFRRGTGKCHGKLFPPDRAF